MKEHMAQFKDEKSSKDQLLKDLHQARKNHFVLNRMYDHQIKIAQHYEDKADKFESQNKSLVQQLKAIQLEHDKKMEALQDKLMRAIKAKQKSRQGISGNILEKNDEIKKKVIDESKGKLWSQVKFIQSNEEETEACKMLFKIGDFDKKLVDTKQKRLNLVETYKTVCKKSVFLRRNYATSEMKKMIMRRYWTDDVVLSLEDLVMCLQRKIETEDDMKKFMIYWEEYLPREVGAMEWSDKIRNYVTITRALRKDNTSLALITPDDEAFCVLCVHNGMARWEKEHKKLKAAAQMDGVASRPKPKKGDTAAQVEKKDVGNFDGLFTKTTTGQNHWGGWSEEGLEQFIEYRAMNIFARQEDNNDQVEKDCLHQLRLKHGIEDSCETAEEHTKNLEAKRRLQKRGRGEEALPPKKKVVKTIIFDSDSSDDEDE